MYSDKPINLPLYEMISLNPGISTETLRTAHSNLSEFTFLSDLVELVSEDLIEFKESPDGGVTWHPVDPSEMTLDFDGDVAWLANLDQAPDMAVNAQYQIASGDFA